jgi:general secretion pathway protein C
MAMELLLRRYLWSVDVIAIGICAVLLGSAAALLVAQHVPSRAMPTLVAKPTALARAWDKSPVPLIERNIFCSDCTPREEPTTEATEAPPGTPLPLTVLAIMYAPPPHDDRWSRVVLRDMEDRSLGAYGIGDRVRGADIVEIGSTRVTLRVDGRTECLDLLAQSKPLVAAPVVAASQSPSLGVKKLAEDNYEIRRSTLESMLGDTARLTSAARPIVEIRDGRPVGFRLMAVRTDGPLGQLGLRNGDVVSAINGLALTSPEQALEVYLKLRSASHVTINVERDGRRQTQEYRIR